MLVREKTKLQNEPSPCERVGDRFDPKSMDKAQLKSWEALGRISEALWPGMLEEEAVRIANQILAEMGVRKFWHRTHIRFGANTLKDFSESSQAGVRLGSDDIYFIDIGPVFDGFEGDVGATFVTGSHPEMLRCKDDVKRLYNDVADIWRSQGICGKDLYAYADSKAKEWGWELVFDKVRGHRLSEFPHSFHFDGTLHDFNGSPQSHRWILEVQIRHPKESFGAFYEDLLVGG